MKTKDISKEVLVEAAKIFEKEVKKCDFDSILNAGKRIYRFSGKLRNKMVVISDHAFPKKYFESVLPELVSVFKTSGNLSDKVDFIFYTPLKKTAKRDIQEIGLNEGFEVEVIDKNDLLGLDAIKQLIEPEDTEDTNRFMKTAFDYLSKSNDSSFVKNGLYYSQVLFIIFENENITVSLLQNKLEELFGRKIDSLDSDINYLRRTGKICKKEEKNGNELVLSDDEKQSIQASINESQTLETEFITGFNAIMETYAIYDSNSAFNVLRSYHVNRSISVLNAETCDTNNLNQRKIDYDSLSTDLIHLGCPKERVSDCIKEISSLCSNNGYLNRIGVMQSFFNLYKSNKYKEYIASKMNVVMFDTPVFLHYLCSRSKYNDHPLQMYDDDDFRAVNSLMRFRDRNGKKLKFLLPYDYASEVIGELKKALQLTQFETLDDIGIPIMTSNILFNYYQYVKTELGIEFSSFGEFAKELGFQNVDLDSSRIYYDNYSFLRTFVETLGDEYIDRKHVMIENYDSIISSYSNYLLEERKFGKTSRAIEADVRQTYSLLNAERDEKKEYYLTTWDSTLYMLREIVKEKTNNVNSYAIHRPGALINRLSLKDFRIDDSSFTSEIFTYADKSYSVSEKIKNLFDNVLVPYFSTINSKNTELVKAVVNLQKAEIDNKDEGQKSKRDAMFPLELLFCELEEEMRKDGCSQQDLRLFLADNNNNVYFLKVLDETKRHSRKDKIIELSKQFCEELKKYIALKDREDNEDENLSDIK